MYFLMMSVFFALVPVSGILADSWNGADYAKNSSVQLSHAGRLLSHLSLKGDETILDVGCGDGKITAMLSERVSRGVVIGLDPSLSMLTKAEEMRKEITTPNLFFRHGCAEDFSFEERFDHIIAIHVMHWIKEQERALKNVYAHLKQKGHVHFILAPSKEGLPFHRALEKTVSAWQEQFSDFVNPQQAFDMETYRKLMVEAGFHVEAIQYVYHESIHANIETLKAWVKQWLPHGKHLPLEQQDVFLEELMTNYLIEIGYSDETLSPVPWGEYVLFVEGMKL